MPAADEPSAAPVAGLVAQYERQLAEVGRLDTPEGAHVLLLAGLLAHGEGMTAAGAASLSKELRAAMAEAVKDAAVQGDLLDELAERRAQKASGA